MGSHRNYVNKNKLNKREPVTKHILQYCDINSTSYVLVYDKSKQYWKGGAWFGMSQCTCLPVRKVCPGKTFAVHSKTGKVMATGYMKDLGTFSYKEDDWEDIW